MTDHPSIVRPFIRGQRSRQWLEIPGRATFGATSSHHVCHGFADVPERLRVVAPGAARSPHPRGLITCITWGPELERRRSQSSMARMARAAVSISPWAAASFAARSWRSASPSSRSRRRSACWVLARGSRRGLTNRCTGRRGAGWGTSLGARVTVMGVERATEKRPVEVVINPDSLRLNNQARDGGQPAPCRQPPHPLLWSAGVRCRVLRGFPQELRSGLAAGQSAGGHRGRAPQRERIPAFQAGDRPRQCGTARRDAQQPEQNGDAGKLQQRCWREGRP